VPIVPLHGHLALRRRLTDSIARRALPSSLLIHGPAGVGKQRLALWLGQHLLCSSSDRGACGECQSCRYAATLVHPDLRWFFPRPRLADGDATTAEVLADYADAIAERVKSGGLYAAPSGSEGIYVSTVRALVSIAAMTPSVARRKVIVVGDAERMVPQEGADQAANAFLKLLEEPPADTTIVLTSSEPGALLPTIRSRVVAFRAAPLPEADVRAWLTEPMVRDALSSVEALPDGMEARIRVAAGRPGALLDGAESRQAAEAARALLGSIAGGRADRMRAVFGLGGSRARGFFSDVLDALTLELRERARQAAERSDLTTAAAAARGIDAVERAKEKAAGNVSPQLLGASLVRQLRELMT
jgi:DNA polymerase-3 subunit delta'